MVLERNARGNGFYDFTRQSKLENDETWPDWRETAGWAKTVVDNVDKPNPVMSSAERAAYEEVSRG